ncbi:hypothetical protein [Azovibrio restrictus]|uniref:hypothetical protein n=1 Tax=Azovibrio restrictus TaxID=146938 RepID=UPI0026F1807E|nr:hypothetical protein [Azovibrio restrictus]MDD3484324.1 hypothetical protein [Azovibrio restrictus]
MDYPITLRTADVFPEGVVRVHWHGKPAGMRKSFDGLQALVRQNESMPAARPA